MALTPAPASTELVPRSIYLDPAQVPGLVDGLIPEGTTADIAAQLRDAKELARVEDSTAYQLAIDVAGRLKGYRQKIESLTRPMTELLFAMHKAATGRRGQLVDRLDGEIRRLETIAGAWYREQERKRREEEERRRRDEEARVAAEQQRIEAAARAEQERLAREAEAARLAGDEARAGEAELEAVAVLEEAEAQVEILAATPIAQVLSPPVLPEGVRKGASNSTKWDAELADVETFCKTLATNPTARALIESELAKIVPKAFRDLARSQGERLALSIPGLRAVDTAKTIARAIK
jgi:hypothetical protein